LDPVLQTKLAQERKLARWLRGTLSKLIDDWHKTGPYDRQALILATDHKLSKILFEHQNRTSLIVRNRTLPNNHQLHRTDSNFLVSGVVKSLIDLENNGGAKGVFKQKIRKWATNTAVRLTQRDVEEGRWAEVQQSTNGLIFKRWVSRMDGVERPDHHNAHLRYSVQAIPVNEPFVIGPRASRLRFPGDTALGAGPEQTFFCRCRAEFYDANGKKIRTEKAREHKRKNKRRTTRKRQSAERTR
jgi:hypothetical protein